MKTYKLLTPGPLTTTKSVKEEMLIDRCTWDDEYKMITQKIRNQLLEIASAPSERYTTVLMQGSGSFGVEATLCTAISTCDKCLLLINGAYGERIAAMADRLGIHHTVYATKCDSIHDIGRIRNILENDYTITHIVMVHCETTTGILNPLEEVARISLEFGKTLIVDAMSSFGGIPIDMQSLGIDFLISSANKCIQGVPGFSFVIARKDKLSMCKGHSSSLALDLYDQWRAMDKSGKWRYTSPTHVVAAFAKALDELEAEGGVSARHVRYHKNNVLLRSRLSEAGIESYIASELQSPIITTFLFPDEDFDFECFYSHVKDRGYIMYPGKLTDKDTFRIGNIGEIYEENTLELCNIIEDYMRGRELPPL
ncbi:2-aminoethylphosphonate--pyruvate transaminase PhnW [Peptoclostridium acidaminophilum DSM 3953]|uniref:2-aminoethylphosphonate--pyruvate transaminase n=1 Tax=Peptoclostridium acidaminophilum DSM 3953 TaxID=1286171 RepID=W8THT2_PEPAC|nr:2-aminoethylphosphonate--pyruvate transaminase [Peptoclostridium acidaminophilum]AHM57403.1 2-aminoethylphosphonate--pyruvate transaminase PhnW [Peptoclostridium acidaminophilum DSM 3953]